jgi:hypothetical protein
MVEIDSRGYTHGRVRHSIAKSLAIESDFESEVESVFGSESEPEPRSQTELEIELQSMILHLNIG